MRIDLIRLPIRTDFFRHNFSLCKIFPKTARLRLFQIMIMFCGRKKAPSKPAPWSSLHAHPRTSWTTPVPAPPVLESISPSNPQEAGDLPQVLFCYQHRTKAVSVRSFRDNCPLRVVVEPALATRHESGLLYLSTFVMPKRRKKHAGSAKMWLDELPEDICIRIAAFVTRGCQNDDGLDLADASPKQARAVVATLSDKLVFDYSNTHLVKHWIKLLSGNVREINATDWDLVYVPRFRYGFNRHLLDLLSAPMLQTAEITADKPTLRAIQKSVSLRRLYVHIDKYCPDALLFETLKCLKLEDITLQCNGFSSEDCAFENISEFRDNNAILAECLPGLRALEVRCTCDGCDNAMWRFLPMTPSVREIRITSETYEPPEDVLSTLQSLDAVEISHVPHGKSLARELGTIVTKLHIQDEALNSEDVSNLCKCPNLYDLNIIIEEGVELLLLERMSSIRGLRSLALVFEQSVFGSNSHYYEPASGIMANIVGGLHDLEDLSLPFMRLELCELKSILVSIGPRLKRFQTSCDGQEEAELGRLEALLSVAIRNNSGLQSFELRQWLNESRPELEGLPATERDGQFRRLKVLVRLLKERAPLLNEYFLEEFVGDKLNSGNEYGTTEDDTRQNNGPGPCVWCCAICTYAAFAFIPYTFFLVVSGGWKACKAARKAVQSCLNDADES